MGHKSWTGNDGASLSLLGWTRMKSSPAWLGSGEHGCCFLASRFSARLAAQHASKFFQAVGLIKQLDSRDGTVATARLANCPVRSGVAGHLRQVGHANDLMRLSQGSKLLADDITEAAANTCVNLVENQRDTMVVGGQDGL